LIFDTAVEIRYEMALRRIGIEPAMLSMEAGHA
jgi:putative transcriptional regulator